jgi:hypothetical protein
MVRPAMPPTTPPTTAGVATVLLSVVAPPAPAAVDVAELGAPVAAGLPPPATIPVPRLVLLELDAEVLDEVVVESVVCVV